MNETELLESLENLRVWKKNDVRAPHKPLLILYALGRYINDDVKMIPYMDMYEDFKRLLIDYGPTRKQYYPNEPFARLKTDNIWKHNLSEIEVKHGWLRDHNVSGGFTDDVISLLTVKPELIAEIINNVLDMHFPESYHQDILQSVGLANEHVIRHRVEVTRTILPRDSRFRQRILNAYNGSCAVCGYNLTYRDKIVGLEAAHIKWHQYAGPDIETNGMALCALHHKLFDRGAFTLDCNHKVEVSKHVGGSSGVDQWLGQYEGQRINMPSKYEYSPREDFVNWHMREVYRG